MRTAIGMRFFRLAPLAGLAAFQLISAGCELLDDLEKPDLRGDSCSSATALATASGTWQLQGFGKRDSCSDDLFDTDSLRLEAVPIVVTQVDDVLTLGQPLSVPAGVSFDVVFEQVRGSCVDFVTTETSGNTQIRYDFEGTVGSDGKIRGEFTGTGPGSCKSEGTFVIDR
jgi:hypothetical protein